MTLHPVFRAYLDQLNPLIAEANANGVQPTPESARAALAGLNQFALPAVPVAQIEERAIEYRDDAGENVRVPVRVYVPTPGVASDVILFVHGGGHMAGDPDVYDYSARRTAAATSMVVVSVDYRRSPEAKFPLGLTDTYQVALRIEDVLGDIAHTSHLYAVADSGGAAKVSSIAMRTAAGEWRSPIERQVLLYPSLDYTMSGQSVADYGTGYFLEANRIQWYFDNYFPEGVDRAAASPVSGAFNAEMAQTLVLAAEYDPLLSEAESYVERMRAAGADAQLITVPGMIHAYAFFETMVPDEVLRSYEVIAEFLRTGKASW